jgi:hypothetical protein
MSYLPGLGKHVPARTLQLICQVCDGTGWLQAARIVQRVTGEGERGFVDTFTPIPCFACGLKGIAVLT